MSYIVEMEDYVLTIRVSSFEWQKFKMVMPRRSVANNESDECEDDSTEPQDGCTSASNFDCLPTYNPEVDGPFFLLSIPLTKFRSPWFRLQKIIDRYSSTSPEKGKTKIVKMKIPVNRLYQMTSYHYVTPKPIVQAKNYVSNAFLATCRAMCDILCREVCNRICGGKEDNIGSGPKNRIVVCSSTEDNHDSVLLNWERYSMEDSTSFSDSIVFGRKSSSVDSRNFRNSEEQVAHAKRTTGEGNGGRGASNDLFLNSPLKVTGEAAGQLFKKIDFHSQESGTSVGERFTDTVPEGQDDAVPYTSFSSTSNSSLYSTKSMRIRKSFHQKMESYHHETSQREINQSETTCATAEPERNSDTSTGSLELSRSKASTHSVPIRRKPESLIQGSHIVFQISLRDIPRLCTLESDDDD